MADLPNTACSIPSNFNAHQIIFDITYQAFCIEDLTADFAAIGQMQSTLLGVVQELARTKSHTILIHFTHHIGVSTV